MTGESFKKRFLPYNDKLYRIAYRFFGDSCDAEDMVQNLYLKLWEKREQLETVDNDEAFCVTMLKNMCYDKLRSQTTKMESDEAIPDRADEEDTTQKFEQRDELEQVKRCVEQLPEQQKKVIKLRMRECEVDEIEEITGLTAINIRTLLSRARKSLRESYNQLIMIER